MSFLRQTLQKSLPAPSERPNATDHHRWPWIAAALLVVGLVAVGSWAWSRFVTTGDSVTQSSTSPSTLSSTSVMNATNTSGTDTITTMQTESIAQTQSMKGKAPAQQPTIAPTATATVATTQVTSSMVAIAGADGAILLTAANGAQIGSLEIGALLNVTGRSADNGWLYVSNAAGVAGWVAVEQVVAFGIEKLPVVTVTTPPPATAGTNESVRTPASTAITATVASSATTASTTTATVSATNRTTVTVAAEDPSRTSATSVTATVIVNGARLNIRSGPGTRYGIVSKVSRNETVTVLARNAAADWVQIALPDSEDGFGWVAAAYLRLSSAIADLPVSNEVSAAPAMAATTTASTATVASTSATQSSATQSSAIQPAAVVSANPATGLNGTLVFQSSPGGTIYAYHLATGRLWQLTHGFDPAISPDGQTVAFVRTAGENGIYLINLDGSNERLVFSGRSTLAAPKWSPDGTYIVFTRGDEYKECRDLGRGQCLTDKELLDQNPNFPVDNFPLIKDYESNLARVDTNGGNYRDLANLESARAADWNEAGIVYQSSAGLQITADKPDATSQLVIHDPYKPAYEDPDWQPGPAGSPGKILFVSRGGNHREIFAVNPDGSGMVALTRPVTTLVDELPNNVAPAWSPDGQHIVFLSNRGDNNSAGAWKLWVMDADGSNQYPLPITVAINYTYGNEQLVSWGP